MRTRAFDSICHMAAAVWARLGGAGQNAEVVVRTADAFPIAAHWVEILNALCPDESARQTP